MVNKIKSTGNIINVNFKFTLYLPFNGGGSIKLILLPLLFSLTQTKRRCIIECDWKGGSIMKAFVKKELTFVIAAVAAIISCFFVIPDMEYVGYIDFKVITLLFCLMTTVGGIQKTGFFERLSESMLKLAGGTRSICIILVLLCFFAAMLITNDVALIILVPFAITVLSKAGAKDLIVKTIVLQTVSANLGSMATPVGNPQNLFLYSYYNMGIGEFFEYIIPYTAISFGFVVLCSACGKNKKISFNRHSNIAVDRNRLLIYIILFVLCLLTVTDFINYIATTVITAVALFITDRKLLLKTDYFLLLTFICFFVFSGNLGRIDFIRRSIELVLAKNTILSALLTSQVISNVPAAVLLAPFTQNAKDLLAGVNIGGLGTPVASLASLISLKLYMTQPEAKAGKYMLVFFIYNLAGIVFLLGISAL